MKDRTRELLDLLNKWERACFDNERAFLARFCNDAWQLVDVCWGPENMKVTYVTGSELHVVNSFPINEWIAFYEEAASDAGKQ